MMLNQGKAYLQKALEEHPNMRPELRAAVVFALAEADETIAWHPSLINYGRAARILQPEALAMTGLAMLDVHDPRATEIATLLASKAAHQGDLVSWKGSYLPLLDTT